MHEASWKNLHSIDSTHQAKCTKSGSCQAAWHDLWEDCLGQNVSILLAMRRGYFFQVWMNGHDVSPRHVLWFENIWNIACCLLKPGAETNDDKCFPPRTACKCPSVVQCARPPSSHLRPTLAKSDRSRCLAKRFQEKRFQRSSSLKTFLETLRAVSPCPILPPMPSQGPQSAMTFPEKSGASLMIQASVCTTWRPSKRLCWHVALRTWPAPQGHGE